MFVRDTPLPKSARVQENNAPAGLKRTLSYLEPDMQTVALLVAGEGEWCFEGQWHALRSGWMNWRYPEERKRIRSASGYRTIVFRFHMQRHGKLRLPRFCAWRDPFAARQWAETEYARLGNRTVDALQARLWYDRLLAEVQYWQERPVAEIQADLLLDALRYIELHFADPALDIPGLATELHCSERALYHVFKQQHHCTPQQHIVQQRIAQARHYLMHADLSIAEIGEAVGFLHATSFSRAFKQLTGSSPAAWRRMHQ